MNIKTKLGFTLLEILVVVLIIGILGAIALPQYQRAVLKSRFSGMMPIAKALAEANEVFYLEHGNYSENPADLLVAGRNTAQDGAYPDGTSVLMYSDEADLSFVRTENASIPNARYVVYQKHSTNFPDTTWCEASDERAEEMCEALGGVMQEGLEGNSSGTDGWKAYLLSGTAREGDTFASASGGGCSGSAPANITASQSGATGTASCVNGEWVYEWTGGATYENYVGCEGTSSYECAGSTFSGKNSYCSAHDANGCAGSTFSGEYSQCYGHAANACASLTFSGESSRCDGQTSNACASSTFSGEGAICNGWAVNACAGSTFSGLGSYCYGMTDHGCTGVTISGEWGSCEGSEANACAGAEIQAGAYCRADNEGVCDGAIYTTHPDKGDTLTGCCYSDYGYCPAGSPKCGEWNDTTHAFDIDGTW